MSTLSEAPSGPPAPERPDPVGPGRVVTGWVLALVGLPVMTAALVAVRRDASLSFESMLYLALAIGCALVGGRWPAVAAAVLGTAALNFWFTAPVHTLKVTSARDLLTLVVFVVTSLLVAGVVDSAARRRARAILAEDEASTLGMLNREVLGGGYDVPQLLELVRRTFGGSGVELVGNEERVRPGDTVVPATATSQLVLHDRSLDGAQRRVLAAFASHVGVVRQREELARQTAAAQELEAGNRTRTALLAAVSHDLRTPLAGIRSAAETLRSRGDRLAESDRAELLAAIEQSTGRLTTMVSDLLDMSRLQTGAVQPTLVEVPLGEVVDRVLADLDASEAARVQVGPLPAARVDAVLLERVLANLVANALQHSPVARIEGSETGRVVELRVADRGPGVPLADRARMFEPFQRLGDTPAGEGVGLGLAVARGLTEAQGGSLRAEDEPGGGLVMVLQLPGARPDEAVTS